MQGYIQCEEQSSGQANNKAFPSSLEDRPDRVAAQRVEVDWWIRSLKLGLFRLELGPGRTGPRANGGINKGNNLDDLSRYLQNVVRIETRLLGGVLYRWCWWRGVT